MTQKIINVSGKRKMAVARATARKGEGRIRINNTPLEIYTPELSRLKIREALHFAGDYSTQVDIDVDVRGGGVMGQAEAARTAIARAIYEFTGDDSLREKFIAYDRTLLVNDTRRKEAKHQLGAGARKKKQKSYR